MLAGHPRGVIAGHHGELVKIRERAECGRVRPERDRRLSAHGRSPARFGAKQSQFDDGINPRGGCGGRIDIEQRGQAQPRRELAYLHPRGRGSLQFGLERLILPHDCRIEQRPGRGGARHEQSVQVGLALDRGGGYLAQVEGNRWASEDANSFDVLGKLGGDRGAGGSQRVARVEHARQRSVWRTEEDRGMDYQSRRAEVYEPTEPTRLWAILVADHTLNGLMPGIESTRRTSEEDPFKRVQREPEPRIRTIKRREQQEDRPAAVEEQHGSGMDDRAGRSMHGSHASGTHQTRPGATGSAARIRTHRKIRGWMKLSRSRVEADEHNRGPGRETGRGEPDRPAGKSVRLCELGGEIARPGREAAEIPALVRQQCCVTAVRLDEGEPRPVDRGRDQCRDRAPAPGRD